MITCDEFLKSLGARAQKPLYVKTNEQVYYDALWIVAREYQSPQKIMRTAERQYGCTGEEALIMAYENMQEIARMAIKGKRRPK